MPELTVWLGIIILSGTSPRRRFTHYWSSEHDGLHHPTIAKAMKKSRYLEIYAHLPFAFPDDQVSAGQHYPATA